MKDEELAAGDKEKDKPAADSQGQEAARASGDNAPAES